MSISTDEVISHNKGVDSAHWVVNSNRNCSSFSASAVLSHPAATNFGSIISGKLRFFHNIDKRREERTKLVVQNLYLLKGKTLVSTLPQLLIAPDTSLRGLGAFVKDKKLGDPAKLWKTRIIKIFWNWKLPNKEFWLPVAAIERWNQFIFKWTT